MKCQINWTFDHQCLVTCLSHLIDYKLHPSTEYLTHDMFYTHTISNHLPDMEKFQSFDNNSSFRKYIYQNFHNWLEILWKSSFIGYKYDKYLIFKKKFLQSMMIFQNPEISAILKNFHRQCLRLFPCLGKMRFSLRPFCYMYFRYQFVGIKQ